MKIALIGYGKMGKTIERLALERGHVITEKFSTNNPFLNQKEVEADVAIEFTNPEAAKGNILKCLEAKVPVVVGTTGWYHDFDEIKKLA